MERWNRESTQDANIRWRSFGFVDFLTVLAVLLAVVLAKPQFEKMLQRGQRDSASQPVKADQAPTQRPPDESEPLLLASP